MSSRNKQTLHVDLRATFSSFNLPNLLPTRECRCNHDGTDIIRSHVACPNCRKPLPKMRGGPR